MSPKKSKKHAQRSVRTTKVVEENVSLATATAQEMGEKLSTGVSSVIKNLQSWFRGLQFDQSAQRDAQQPWTKLTDAVLNNFTTGLLLISAYLIGVLTTEVRYLKSGAPTGAAVAQNQQQATPAPRVLSDDVWKEMLQNPVGEVGDKKVELTMVEFVDYQCPVCYRHFVSVYPSIKKEFVDTGKMRIIYRDMPLTSIHPNAEIAAVAARCAVPQNKWSDMHDLIMNKQQEWSPLVKADAEAKFAEYAASLGMNKTQFVACQQDEAIAQAVKDDSLLSQKFGINATPTFVVNKKEIVGTMAYELFKTVLK